jgi:hypothetical protein
MLLLDDIKLQIIRKAFKDEYIIGDLYFFSSIINICNTLENAQKAIPEGRYKLVTSYMSTFKRDYVLLEDVPGRSAIFIHPGNTAKDSKGCILPGINDKIGFVSNSTKFAKWLCDTVACSKQAYITIQRRL